MEDLDEIGGGDAFQWPHAKSAERSRMVEAVLHAQFPQAVRGYDREAVDSYVEQVRQVIAELEASATPSAAVTRAMREAANMEVTELRASARQDTDQLIAAAESRVRELDDSAERLLEERRRLLEDMESVSRQLDAIARVEAGRFPEPSSSMAAAGEQPAREFPA